MSAAALDLLAEAYRHGVRLIATPAGTIKARALTAPPAELLAKLKAHRAELVAALGPAENGEGRQDSAKAANNTAWRSSAELAVFGNRERSSVPAEWLAGCARLDPARPSADVPLRRWQQFIDDVGRFLDNGFAARAAALGWGPFDIFGCDRDRPFARIDQQGLCWLVTGNRVVNLFENAAVIQTWTGQRQTWRRKPSEPGRVLAWELADSEPREKGV